MNDYTMATEASAIEWQYKKGIFIYTYHVLEHGGEYLDAILHLVSPVCIEESENPIGSLMWSDREQYNKLVDDFLSLDVDICSSVLERVATQRMDLGNLSRGEFGGILRQSLKNKDFIWSIEVEEDF